MFRSKAKAARQAIILLSATLLAPAAFAGDDTPPPDKSQYNLFNPVPDNLMRSFSTDGPTKSDSAYTVDAGHFQYEADMVNWTYDRWSSSGTTTSNILVLDPTFKVGLTQNTELEVALAPININYSKDRTTGNTSSLFGFGDVYARVKFNLFGNDGGDYALAIVPYVKAPTAERNLGNDHWEGGAYVPFNVALPDDWSLSLLTELDILENSNLNGTHANYQNLINFGHPIIEHVTGYVELWNGINTDQGAQPQYTLDFAVTWLVKDNWQLDWGVNVGLDKAAPDLQSYIGISQRF